MIWYSIIDDDDNDDDDDDDDGQNNAGDWGNSKIGLASSNAAVDIVLNQN